MKHADIRKQAVEHFDPWEIYDIYSDSLLETDDEGEKKPKENSIPSFLPGSTLEAHSRMGKPKATCFGLTGLRRQRGSGKSAGYVFFKGGSYI